MTDAINTAAPSAPPQNQVKPSSQEPLAMRTPNEKRAAPVAKLEAPARPKAQLIDLEDVRESLAEAIAALNEQMEKNGRGLKFSVDETINRHIIIVSNTQTGEVVRQIPTEVAVRVAHSIEDIKGLLSDESA